MPLNFKNICRLCLSEDVDLRQIFCGDFTSGENEGITALSEKIMSCTHIQMSAEDGLPTMVCHRCMYQLDLWFAFKQLSERSDTFLRKQVDNHSSLENPHTNQIKREVETEWTLADEESACAFALDVAHEDGPDQEETATYDIDLNHIEQTFSEPLPDTFVEAVTGIDEGESINSLRANIGELSYICHECNRTFQSVRAYAVHKAKAHPDANNREGRHFRERKTVCHPDRKTRLVRRVKIRSMPSSNNNTLVPRTVPSAADNAFVSKRQCCTFCNKHFAKLPRHFETAHGEEPEVIEYLKYPKYSTERADRLTELRNRGNYVHNQTVISTGKGVMIPARRTPLKDSASFKPCPFCFRFLRRHTLRIHIRRCKKNPHSERYVGGM